MNGSDDDDRKKSKKQKRKKPGKHGEFKGTDALRKENKMAKDAGITKTAAAAALASFMTGVTKALKKKNGKVTLVGFGTFKKVYRKTRKGRNPQTGEVIKIKGKNVVKFTTGKKLQDAI